MKRLLWLAITLSLGCASASVPIATGPTAWQVIDEPWSLHVVTIDPDGGERVTRIWLAVVDGRAGVRTNGSRWWRNLERDPTIRVRARGVDHVFHADTDTNFEDRVLIDQTFLQKYGRWERILFPQARGDTHDDYAWLYPERQERTPSADPASGS